VKKLKLKARKNRWKKTCKLANEPEINFCQSGIYFVNKPAGLIVHRRTAYQRRDATDWLWKKYPELKKVGEDKTRTRHYASLRQNVSGLLVTRAPTTRLKIWKNNFKIAAWKKIYTALVYGNIAKDNDKIEFSLKRSAGGHRQAAVPEGYNFKENFLELREAYTEFQIIKRLINYTFVIGKNKKRAQASNPRPPFRLWFSFGRR